MISDVPVVATPAEVDLTSAGHLDAVLQEAASGSGPAVVVDMTRTQFCDSAGLHCLVRANKRFRAEGRQLRLAISEGSAVSRVVSLTGLDSVIACYASLSEALAPLPDGATPQPGPNGTGHRGCQA